MRTHAYSTPPTTRKTPRLPLPSLHHLPAHCDNAHSPKPLEPQACAWISRNSHFSLPRPPFQALMDSLPPSRHPHSAPGPQFLRTPPSPRFLGSRVASGRARNRVMQVCRSGPSGVILTLQASWIGQPSRHCLKRLLQTCVNFYRTPSQLPTRAFPKGGLVCNLPDSMDARSCMQTMRPSLGPCRYLATLQTYNSSDSLQTIFIYDHRSY